MALIAASAVRTCLGDGPTTFARLLAGDSGVGDLRHIDAGSVNVKRGYHINDDGEPARQATRWLAACLGELLAGLDQLPARVPVIVGTGLRELRTVEHWAVGVESMGPAQLHFTAAVREVSGALGPVITISNACSASGHALGLAQDLLDHGYADAVIAAGADAITASMLAMIGRVTEEPAGEIRPFDVDRTGVLLGEGAAAVLLVSDDWRGNVVARLLGTGMSCDAYHETVPALDGISRAMQDALRRAGCEPSDVDVVVSHGTGTILNDITESTAIQQVLVRPGGAPWVTGVKGSLGHTSGASSLMNLDVAIRCLSSGRVPPIVGLRKPLAEAAGLKLVQGGAVQCAAAVAQVNSFGFGGVNAVTLIGGPS